MSLKQIIVETYPELSESLSVTDFGIYLQDDSDGLGAFIAKWEYEKPIPEGLKLGK